MQKNIIITAGGTGKRFGSKLPKQFVALNGEPILFHTIRRFTSVYPDIQVIVVLPQNHILPWKKLCEKHNFNIPHEIAVGGEERFHSVRNGVRFVKANSITGIHDGVRPLVSKSVIKACFEAAEEHGSAIPVLPINESIRMIDNGTSRAVNRDQFKIVQTPQCFRSDLLIKAYKQDYQKSYTDDATVVESMGESIHLIEGNHENVKITRPNDLERAEQLISLLDV